MRVVVYVACVLVVFFFFQAEDGIRDLTVTGVQTCALPILRGRVSRVSSRRATKSCWRAPPAISSPTCARHQPRELEPLARQPADVYSEIGRASCRERV